MGWEYLGDNRYRDTCLVCAESREYVVKVEGSGRDDRFPVGYCPACATKRRILDPDFLTRGTAEQRGKRAPERFAIPCEMCDEKRWVYCPPWAIFIEGHFAATRDEYEPGAEPCPRCGGGARVYCPGCDGAGRVQPGHDYSQGRNAPIRRYPQWRT